MALKKNDHVRHVTDPHGRSHGTVEHAPDNHGLVRVRWFGPHEPEDWEETVLESELREWHPSTPKEKR